MLKLSKPRHGRKKCVAVLLSCETLSAPKDPAFLSKCSTPASTFTDTVCLPDLTIFTWERGQTQQFTCSENVRRTLALTGLPGMSEQAAVWRCSWHLHWKVVVQAPVDSTELPGCGWSLRPVMLSAPLQTTDSEFLILIWSQNSSVLLFFLLNLCVLETVTSSYLKESKEKFKFLILNCFLPATCKKW